MTEERGKEIVKEEVHLISGLNLLFSQNLPNAVPRKKGFPRFLTDWQPQHHISIYIYTLFIQKKCLKISKSLDLHLEPNDFMGIFNIFARIIGVLPPKSISN